MALMREIIEKANSSKHLIAKASNEQKNKILSCFAEAFVRESGILFEANTADLNSSEVGEQETQTRAIRIKSETIRTIAKLLLSVVDYPDPVGCIFDCKTLPNGIVVNKMSSALGLIGIVCESNPYTIMNAVALSLKSGSACIVCTDRQNEKTGLAMLGIIKEVLKNTGFSEDLVGFYFFDKSEELRELLTAEKEIDLLILRGEKNTIDECADNTKLPTIKLASGLNHIYVNDFADFEKALSIIDNAYANETTDFFSSGVCLVDKDIEKTFLPKLYDTLVLKHALLGTAPVDLKLDQEAYKYILGTPASEYDFDTVFQNNTLVIKIVDGIDEAIEHIRKHSSHYCDSIITEDFESAEYFVNAVDSAVVYINASTRLTNGSDLGEGLQLGISSKKLPARGPIGLNQLVAYKYVVNGKGQL